MAERFSWSLDTVSRKFGEVLDAVVSFAHRIIRSRDSTFRFVHPKLQPFSSVFMDALEL